MPSSGLKTNLFLSDKVDIPSFTSLSVDLLQEATVPLPLPIPILPYLLPPSLPRSRKQEATVFYHSNLCVSLSVRYLRRPLPNPPPRSLCPQRAAPQDLDNLKRWQYKVVDNSITTTMLTPIWNRLVLFVPANVAPNVLTLAAFGCVLQAFWLVVWHGDEFPRASAVGAAILTYIYFTLDALDGKHARNTKNGSPLGELFDHGCDNLGAAFQVITLLKILGW